jgi:hypothetical protein
MWVTITTRDGLRREYEAADGRHAVRHFFDEIRAGIIDLNELGFIGTWSIGGGEEVPFRIGPALFMAGMLTAEELDSSFEHAGLELTAVQLAVVLEDDAWMVREAPLH